MDACRLVPGRFSSHGFDFLTQLKCTKSDGILCDNGGGATRCDVRRVLVCHFRMVYINSFLSPHSLMFLTRGWTPLRGTSSVSWLVVKQSKCCCSTHMHVQSIFHQFSRNFSGPSCLKGHYRLPGVKFNPGLSKVFS